MPPLRRRCNFIRPKQLSPFPERLELPFPSEEILSGFEDIVTSGTDQFTAWVKTDPHATLVRKMVDAQKATADFREASERRHDTSSLTYRFNKKMSNRSPVQKRHNIYNWNPGPRRGKEDAFEKQIAGRWHVITLQEASEYVDHDILTCRFHVTHHGGCAILFNEETFYLLYRRQIQVPSWHQARLAWSSDGRRTRMGYPRSTLSCIISSSTTQRPEDFYGVVSTFKQYRRQNTRYCQEGHPHHPCHHDWSTDWRGCRWFHWNNMAMQQQG